MNPIVFVYVVTGVLAGLISGGVWYYVLYADIINERIGLVIGASIAGGLPILGYIVNSQITAYLTRKRDQEQWEEDARRTRAATIQQKKTLTYGLIGCLHHVLSQYTLRFANAQRTKEAYQSYVSSSKEHIDAARDQYKGTGEWPDYPKVSNLLFVNVDPGLIRSLIDELGAFVPAIASSLVAAWFAIGEISKNSDDESPEKLLLSLESQKTLLVSAMILLMSNIKVLSSIVGSPDSAMIEPTYKLLSSLNDPEVNQELKSLTDLNVPEVVIDMVLS